MASRKKISADARKNAKKSTCVATAQRVPTSPRKMRLVADIIRGKDVFQALNILTFTPNIATHTLDKLLRSAINNWEQKFNVKAEDSQLFISEIKVDSGRMIKRFLPAPMGRAYRLRKRSNHVTLALGSRTSSEVIEENIVEENTEN